MSDAVKPIVLAGGHVFPARALAEELSRRGRRLVLITDRRGDAVGGALADIETHRINAASVTGGAGSKLKGLALLGVGVLQARALLRRNPPDAVVGFGGYPSVPTMWVATRMRLPTVIHEQNAVMGRANRLLAPRVMKIATSFARVERIRPQDTHKVVHTGNPVRAAVAAVGALPYPAGAGGAHKLRILILGGSQGAHVMSAVVPAAIAALPSAARAGLAVTQQCREDDIATVRETYDRAGVGAELAPFFDDIPRHLGEAHLVISRAGASTVAELAASGRPAILVPYPHAAHDHPNANAHAAEAAGGAWTMPQDGFTADAVAARIESLLGCPETLAQAAARQLEAGRPDAARRLADMVDALADPDSNGSDQTEPATPREAAA